MKRAGLRSQARSEKTKMTSNPLEAYELNASEHISKALLASDEQSNQEDDEQLDYDDNVRILPDNDDDKYEEHNEHDAEHTHNQNVRKDLHNIALLMFLYFLQGVPLGLTGSLPFILSSRKVSYADQGTFSFAFWPFSLKLLWAPIVDSVFFKRIGRRKSWLVPIQYLIGIFMLSFANYTQQLLDDHNSHSDHHNKGN
jgi:hypothetical protein